MTRQAMIGFVLLTATLTVRGLADDDLASSFSRPPSTANAWCYWWWLNGAASKEGITRDFEEMRRQGISGALLFDAGEAGPPAPRGPEFMSPEWRELFKHAVHEADRCSIVLGVNLCSGWNCGGAWVTAQHAAKTIVAAPTVVKGPGRVSVNLPQPTTIDGFYHDIALLACRLPEDAPPEPKLTASSSFRQYLPPLAEDGLDNTRWISNGDKPGLGPTPEKPEYLQFDYDEAWPVAGLYLKPYSDCGPKEIEIQRSEDGKTYRAIKRATVRPSEEIVVALDEVRAASRFRVVFLSSHPYQGQENWNVQVAEIALLTRAQLEAPHSHRHGIWQRDRVVDLSEFMDKEGHLTWDTAAGTWRVLRIGYTLHGNMTKCVGSGPVGPELDTMSAAAMDAHFAETGAKLIADAGPLAGKTLQYFHIDSWELGQPTWTPHMREEFQRRRGYDPLLFLPSLLGATVDDAETTRRFLVDYRRTAADLVAANYYGRLRELTVQGGMRGTQCESGGPFFDHWIDALQCEGINDIPMGEFWKRNAEPDGPNTWAPDRNPTVKQAACAAHVYGKPVCQAEAFTSFAEDWTADPWNMKDIGDEAFCHGLTRYVLCFWVHQPQLSAKPGYQWVHTGTHFDPNITWWDMSHGWLNYIARCQHMLRQGRFVADFAYFRGEDIPGFIAPRDLQQPLRPAGFDYDALSAEVLLNRATAKDGRLVLPDAMSYRYLVLPHNSPWTVSPAVLQKIKELAEGGVTVVGTRPAEASGLTDYPECDQQVKSLADALWGPETTASGNRQTGSGRVVWGHSLDDVVHMDGLAPDVVFRDANNPPVKLDWIHRRDDNREIYFVSNQAAMESAAEVVFRVSGKQPELWDAVTGKIRELPVYREENGRTVVPLKFAPRESYFVVFRRNPERGSPKGPDNFPALKPVAEITGPWELSFDPQWGGPASVVFERLEDWTKRSEPGIRYYSGTATYRKTFDLPAAVRSSPQPIYLQLGLVKNLARVRLNGTDLGVVWTAPWRVELTTVVQGTGNRLEIDVVNLWPNRLIGDAALLPEKPLTKTNVTTYTKDSPLLESGLLGPVTLQLGE